MDQRCQNRLHPSTSAYSFSASSNQVPLPDGTEDDPTRLLNSWLDELSNIGKPDPATTYKLGERSTRASMFLLPKSQSHVFHNPVTTKILAPTLHDDAHFAILAHDDNKGAAGPPTDPKSHNVTVTKSSSPKLPPKPIYSFENGSALYSGKGSQQLWDYREPGHQSGTDMNKDDDLEAILGELLELEKQLSIETNGLDQARAVHPPKAPDNFPAPPPECDMFGLGTQDNNSRYLTSYADNYSFPNYPNYHLSRSTNYAKLPYSFTSIQPTELISDDHSSDRFPPPPPPPFPDPAPATEAVAPHEGITALGSGPAYDRYGDYYDDDGDGDSASCCIGDLAIGGPCEDDGQDSAFSDDISTSQGHAHKMASISSSSASSTYCPLTRPAPHHTEPADPQRDRLTLDQVPSCRSAPSPRRGYHGDDGGAVGRPSDGVTWSHAPPNTSGKCNNDTKERNADNCMEGSKEEKIRLALQKLKEANIKKMFVKAYSPDGSAKCVLVEEDKTCGSICALLSLKNHLVPDNATWALVEHLPELMMERIMEDHEKLVENLSYWTRDSQNKILFLKTVEKYEMFDKLHFDVAEPLFPTNNIISQHEAPKETGYGEVDTSNADNGSIPKFKEYFVSKFLQNQKNSSISNIADMEGFLYIKLHRKKVWKKYWCILRSSGLYFAPKSGKTTASKDLVCLCRFENINVYYGFGWQKKYKAPTDYGFALKVPQVQVTLSKHTKYFCLEDSTTLLSWVNGIRIAKYGSKLIENFYDSKNVPILVNGEEGSSVVSAGLAKSVSDTNLAAAAEVKDSYSANVTGNVPNHTVDIHGKPSSLSQCTLQKRISLSPSNCSAGYNTSYSSSSGKGSSATNSADLSLLGVIISPPCIPNQAHQNGDDTLPAFRKEGLIDSGNGLTVPPKSNDSPFLYMSHIKGTPYPTNQNVPQHDTKLLINTATVVPTISIKKSYPKMPLIGMAATVIASMQITSDDDNIDCNAMAPNPKIFDLDKNNKHRPNIDGRGVGSAVQNGDYALYGRGGVVELGNVPPNPHHLQQNHTPKTSHVHPLAGFSYTHGAIVPSHTTLKRGTPPPLPTRDPNVSNANYPPSPSPISSSVRRSSLSTVTSSSPPSQLECQGAAQVVKANGSTYPNHDHLQTIRGLNANSSANYHPTINNTFHNGTGTLKGQHPSPPIDGTAHHITGQRTASPRTADKVVKRHDTSGNFPNTVRHPAIAHDNTLRRSSCSCPSPSPSLNTDNIFTCPSSGGGSPRSIGRVGPVIRTTFPSPALSMNKMVVEELKRKQASGANNKIISYDGQYNDTNGSLVEWDDNLPPPPPELLEGLAPPPPSQMGGHNFYDHSHRGGIDLKIMTANNPSGHIGTDGTVKRRVPQPPKRSENTRLSRT